MRTRVLFCCLCFPLLRPYNRNKLQFRSIPCVFLCYPDSFRGYRCLDLNTNKVFICHDVRFDETGFPFATSDCLQVPSPVVAPWGVASVSLPMHMSCWYAPEVPVPTHESLDDSQTWLLCILGPVAPERGCPCGFLDLTL